MKGYAGARTPEGCTVKVHEEGCRERPLDPRLDLRNHSPTGFEWGYGGSGPSQLALALCADALGDDETALRVYQDFKDRVTARLVSEWKMSQAFVRDIVETILEEKLNPGKLKDQGVH